MIETGLDTTNSPTPLATLLASTASSHELAVYCGVLTPRELDAPERETAALPRQPRFTTWAGSEG